MLDNRSTQLSKFRTKKWIEINDKSRVKFNTNNDIRFKTTILKSTLCDYSDGYIHVKGRITITRATADAAARQGDERNTVVIFKNITPLVNCKSEINNIEIDNATDINIVMPMHNLIEYSDNCSKTSESLWQYYKDDPNDNLTDSELITSQIKLSGNTPADGNTKDVEIIAPLKYLSNFGELLKCH